MLNYQQTIDYLFHRLPMFSRIGAAAFKGDLTNTVRLCEAVGNPQKSFKSIHIAGTNGKGSTSHMLAAIMQTAGYKTGLYTSPHLKDFRERIKVNGEMVEESFVIEFTEQIKPVIEEIEPSFFEITVAMAFAWFALQKVDIAVIEVGLGGRLDSTNIITPELAIITNIGYDHMNLLGDTLQKIAGEKAGIIKRGIPVVIGETLPETKPVFESRAMEQNAPLYLATEKRWVADWQQKGHELEVSIADKHTDERKQYMLELTGLYQVKNLLTVLEVVHLLAKTGWKINEKHLQHALKNVRKLTGLHGRWEVIHEHPYTVLDVAHNEDGVEQLTGQLEHCNFQKLHIVIGMVKDKEITTVLSLLPKYAQYYFTKAQIPRALPEEELAQNAAGFGLSGHAFPTVMKALQQAIDDAHKDDMILVCGSVFVVGEVEAEQLKW
ncbi:bifunctional folylpolyglutamate synthase/dihydrofolate synthase [Segetibacter aerophilus]|uniref:Dihydrofolate synthase/folylpolyglutamate synthase n=1 Tax=Segetibacter aerophilus TaxID=670293 RepID=A0A512B6U0_9BACT|nr:folylpolyglutamate synthase/dihydrofolate synthase family protein [Segetibacter aerophilus]GEO07507.1 folylpolyglutamate synthase [Segetibacter aerophilus]